MKRGRKQYYNEETVAVSFKVPKSKKEEFKLFVRTYLNTMKTNNN